MPHGVRPLRLHSAFTLTELLIVIAIIAVLAGLITAAAVNALRAAKRGRIVLEIQTISGSIEDFKNEYGAYPPNGMTPGPVNWNPPPGTIGAMVESDFVRMFKKAFPRHQEPPDLIAALAGITPPSTAIVTSGPLPNGMTAAEALYFWMGGFSSDAQYPISGPGGPSFIDANGDNDGVLEVTDEVLENRNIRFEFDLGRLRPRANEGEGPFTGRFVQYVDHMGIDRQINLWTYAPSGSQQPFVYFDVSRHDPNEYDVWAINPAISGGHIHAFKQLREGVATANNDLNNVVFVNDGRFQILHAGLDDAWGDAFAMMGVEHLGAEVADVNSLLLYPEGPFIGDIADTLTNFTDGAIEDAAEE